MTNRPVLLYLHIPKTAGTNLTHAIYEEYNDSTGSCEEGGTFCEGIYYYPGEPDLVRASRPDRAIFQLSTIVPALRRKDLRAVVSHFSFGLHSFIDRPTTYATVIRHPLERVVSLFYHLKRWPVYGQNEPWLERAGFKPLEPEASLEDFIRDYPLRELDNDQTRRVAGDNPGFGGCTRSLLQLAKSNIDQHFSFVGVTDRFEESLRVATDVLDWSTQPVASKALVHENRKPTLSIPASTREAILERNALDLELYSFANEWLDNGIHSLAISKRTAPSSRRGSNKSTSSPS
jgi:hypothetical protein